MSARKEEIKTNENIVVNEPKFNEKNRTKFSTDNNNFNERTNNALTQQQDAINKTLDNTLYNVKRTTKSHEKFHDIHNVLLNIKKKLFKSREILLLTISKRKNK